MAAHSFNVVMHLSEPIWGVQDKGRAPMRPRRRASDPGHELPDLNDDAASASWVHTTTTALESATQTCIDTQRDVVFAEDRAIR